MTTRSISYTRPGVGLLEHPDPQPSTPTDVLIKVAYASLCGSDLHMLRGDFDSHFGDAPSIPLGHEASGYVAALGPEATRKGLHIGDKVTFYFNHYCGACYHCRNGQEQFCTGVTSTTGFMSDYVVADEQQVFKLHDDADLIAAALIEPASVAMRGIDLCHIKPGQSVAVSGGGGIGQITATLARLSGATALTLIEPVADKRQIALNRGAQRVIDPLNDDLDATVAEITQGRGFDVVIETSGATSACATSMQIAARGATVEFLATYRPDFVFELPMGDAFIREITLVTGVYQSPYLFPRTVAIHEQLDLGSLATVFTPEDYAAGIDAQQNGSSVKSVFHFND